MATFLILPELPVPPGQQAQAQREQHEQLQTSASGGDGDVLPGNDTGDVDVAETNITENGDAAAAQVEAKAADTPDEDTGAANFDASDESRRDVDGDSNRSEVIEKRAADAASAFSVVEIEVAATESDPEGAPTSPPARHSALATSEAESKVATEEAGEEEEEDEEDDDNNEGEAQREEADEDGDEDVEANRLQSLAAAAREEARAAFVPLNDVEFIRKHSVLRPTCKHSELIERSLQRFRDYCEPTCEVWGDRSESSSGLEKYVSKTKDFSMGRIVINAPADRVADAVCADELRTTFNDKLEGA